MTNTATRWMSLCAVVALCLSACAVASRPTATIAAADAAVRDAEVAGAARYASFDLERARYRLWDAKSADDPASARRLAEKAVVDAQLAQVKARLMEARESAAQMRAGETNYGSTCSVPMSFIDGGVP